MIDVIDTLAGIVPGSAVDAVRARRPQARTQAQASHDALFCPADPSGVTISERFAVAAFVAGLHGDATFYATALANIGVAPGLCAAVQDATTAAMGQGPYGSFPPGPLTREDNPGPAYRVADGQRAALGPKLAAALEHAHMLVLHPRDAAQSHLQALLDAGWSTRDIVTLSQLVAFLSYQVRAAAGLRVLATVSSV